MELVGSWATPDRVGHTVTVHPDHGPTVVGHLFDALVDDAGLFPPERLPIDRAVRRHRSDEAAGHPVLTHRFLCPVSVLDELRARLGPDERWRIGLIVDVGLDDLPAAIRTVEADDRLSLETIERRLPTAADARSAVDRVAETTAGAVLASTVYVELSPTADGWAEALAAVADVGLRAKVRCGGLEPAAFPSAPALASFLVAAARRPVPFKATAGLHHAVRYRDPATGFTHHGFLNLLLGTCLAVDGADADEVAAVLLTDDGSRLAERARAVAPGTADPARALFRAYGSCSTSEPIEDLAALGLVEVAHA